MTRRGTDWLPIARDSEILGVEIRHLLAGIPPNTKTSYVLAASFYGDVENGDSTLTMFSNLADVRSSQPTFGEHVRIEAY